VVHEIGNKNNNEDITLSKSEFIIENEVVENALLNYFLKHFKSHDLYNFNIEVPGKNPVFDSVSKIFRKKSEFYVHSADIARKLYDVSEHPNIKRGELYLVYFENCVIKDEIVDAVGIFKSENKDTYLKIYLNNDVYGIDCDNGVNINKLDKACIIFNSSENEGYLLSIIDNVRKSGEAAYWKDDFLMAKSQIDEYYDTSNFLSLCRDFGTQVLSEDNNVDTKDKLEFLENSKIFFKSNDEFDISLFEKEVIKNKEVIDAFNNYRKEYEETNKIKTNDTFDISKDATKNAKKYFRSVIKLDKNFHVYVHSNPDLIEKGYDKEKGMNYYKLYFDKEE